VSGAVRIVVADGHPVYRRGLTALLAAHPGWAVVAQEDTGAGTVAAVLRTEPDLVVMDMDLPHPHAAETVRRIGAECPAAGILVLTARDDGEAMAALVRAGVRGCLLKGADQDPLVRAVTAVAQGEVILPPAAARYLLSGAVELTSREQEVLDLVGAGWSDADIAKVLVLDTAAVRQHVEAIVGEVQAGERAALRARQALVPPRKGPRRGSRRGPSS
jgi:DNA-binding NarL/FixJ family response regulator